MKRILYKDTLQIPYYKVTEEGYGNNKVILSSPYTQYMGYPEHLGTNCPNFIIKDILGFTHFSRGRSSVKAHFKSHINGNKYEMFISDFEEVLLKEYTVNALEGEFCFRKQGQNYGLALLEDD